MWKYGRSPTSPFIKCSTSRRKILQGLARPILVLIHTDKWDSGDIIHWIGQANQALAHVRTTCQLLISTHPTHSRRNFYPVSLILLNPGKRWLYILTSTRYPSWFMNCFSITCGPRRAYGPSADSVHAIVLQWVTLISVWSLHSCFGHHFNLTHTTSFLSALGHCNERRQWNFEWHYETRCLIS